MGNLGVPNPNPQSKLTSTYWKTYTTQNIPVYFFGQTVVDDSLQLYVVVIFLPRAA